MLQLSLHGSVRLGEGTQTSNLSPRREEEEWSAHLQKMFERLPESLAALIGEGFSLLKSFHKDLKSCSSQMSRPMKT